MKIGRSKFDFKKDHLASLCHPKTQTKAARLLTQIASDVLVGCNKNTNTKAYIFGRQMAFINSGLYEGLEIRGVNLSLRIWWGWGALCVEVGFTRTFPGNQVATLK